MLLINILCDNRKVIKSALQNKSIMGRDYKQIVSQYNNPPVAFFDNMNVDLTTFSPARWNRAKRLTEQLDVKIGIITGNGWSTMGDHDTFSRDRDWISAHFKRKIATKYEPKKFRGKELNELDDKIDYFNYQLKDWKVDKILYTLGRHDQLEMIVRTVGELNNKVNKYELNTLRALGNQPERVEYMISLSEWTAKNNKKVDETLATENPEEYRKQMLKIVRAHDKAFFGSKPVEKMKSKSDLDQSTIHEAFITQRDNYIQHLNSKLSRVEVVGFKFNDYIYDHSFSIASNLTSLRSPSKSGLSQLLLSAQRELGNEGTLPDFMVQGMHGTMHFKPFRWHENSHKYTYLMQVPSFEDPQEGFKWRKLQTSALETTKRHDRINAPLGIQLLYVGSETVPHSLGWINKNFIDSGKNIPDEYETAACIGDVHIGHGKTYHSMIRKAFELIVNENPRFLIGEDDAISGGHYANHSKSENPSPPPEDLLELLGEESVNGKRAQLELLESINQPLHIQLVKAQRMFRKLHGGLLNQEGDKTFYILNGHHDALMMIKSGEEWGFGPEAFNQIANISLTLSGQTTPTLDRYDHRTKDHRFKLTTPNGEVYMVYNPNNISLLGDETMYGYNFFTTHQLKGAGNNGSHNNIIHASYDKGDISRANISMSGHFHDPEILAVGNLLHIAKPTFQGRTAFADGTTQAKSIFGNTGVGLKFLHMSEGPIGYQIITPFMSDRLEALLRLDDPDSIWGL